jgi:ribulose-phosphate 3-epimerase
MIEIIPTNTCPPDLAELTERSKLFSEFSTHVQLDIGDGAFVPARSWPYLPDQSAELDVLIRDAQGLPYSDILTYEVHIMAEEPREIGVRFARAKVRRIIGHVEAFADSEEVRTALSAWRSAGAGEVGLALLLDTPLPVIAPLLPACDVVQLMSIARLGYQGAKFEPQIYERIKEVRTAHPDMVIEIDGGVSESNIAKLVSAGATRFGVGSAITKAENPKTAYEHLKSLAESAA